MWSREVTRDGRKLDGTHMSLRTQWCTSCSNSEVLQARAVKRDAGQGPSASDACSHEALHACSLADGWPQPGRRMRNTPTSASGADGSFYGATTMEARAQDENVCSLCCKLDNAYARQDAFKPKRTISNAAM
jgi:hypothetical protein